VELNQPYSSSRATGRLKWKGCRIFRYDFSFLLRMGHIKADGLYLGAERAPIGADQHRTNMLLRKTCERIQIAIGACIHNNEF
jgi:hypothetical protein